MKAAEPGLRTRHLLWFAHQDQTTRAAAGNEGASEVSHDPGARALNQPSVPASSSAATRRASLGQRLSSLASSARAQNANGPLQIRAPYFELYRGPRPQSAPSDSSQLVQSFYEPLRIRAGNLQFDLPPRSASGAAKNQVRGTTPRPAPELVHPPRKATDPQPAAIPLVWRTPTREHLAEVVADKFAKD